MCLYNKEKREKLSEDFHFRFLPSEFQDVRLLLVIQGNVWHRISISLELFPILLSWSISTWDGLLQDNGGGQRSVLFSLEAGSPAICLLIQFEKHVTEEGGVTPSVYTRKDPVSYLTNMSRAFKRFFCAWMSSLEYCSMTSVFSVSSDNLSECTWMSMCKLEIALELVKLFRLRLSFHVSF